MAGNAGVQLQARARLSRLRVAHPSIHSHRSPHTRRRISEMASPSPANPANPSGALPSIQGTRLRVRLASALAELSDLSEGEGEGEGEGKGLGSRSPSSAT